MKLLNSYTLTVLNGEAAGKEWKLFQDVVSLGRHEANHLVFTHPTVSNHQCKIHARNGQLRIENLSRSNQTRVNDVPVDEAELNDGNIIQMGDLDIRVSTHKNKVSPVEEDAGALDEDPHTAATQYIDPDAFSSNDNEPVEPQSGNMSSKVGQYTIESKIAQSGQAILFKGCDESNGESVALKLFTHDETDQVSEARFLRELKILKQLSHKNIVEYRGLFETKGEWGDSKRYLVMEYLQGKTLKELIAENPKGMEWDTVRNIFEQCLLGLIHASKEHNIIHRDIKPSNIFVLEDGTVKIIDFGISRFESESTHTGGSGMMGSFDCMAPDFALADDAGFRGDMVSDIFSLFVCLYHTLTGSLPFSKYGERQELEYLNRWRGSEIKPPSHKHINFRVISRLGGFIDQGLAVDASKRFQSFDAVLDALRSLKNRKVVHKKVDSYELLSGLGAGGCGEVFLGKRKSDGAQVAIKRLHSGSSSKRFIKEATILSQYEHPAIVKYLDFFETVGSSGGRSPFLVLEYLEGATLKKQSAEHPEGMDTKEVLQLFLRYLSALDFLHNAKASIIHRDIKPGNLHVPLDDPSKAKIFDLGIIKDLSGTQTSGKLPGTYYYMAPEMFTTDNRGTSQTDVYAMGLCLYEALTGSPAYPRLPKNDREAIVEMIARAQGERKYRVSYNHRAFRDHPDLVHIVQQAINPDPSARYSDAEHMWEDIASVLEQHFALQVSAIGEGMQASAMGSGSGGGGRRSVKREKALRVHSGGKGKRRRKGLVAGLGIVLLLLVGVYVVARGQLEKIEPMVDSWPEPMRGALMSVLTWPEGREETEGSTELTEGQDKLAAERERLQAEKKKLDEEKKKLAKQKKQAQDKRNTSDFDREMEFVAYGGVNCNSYDEAGRSLERIVRQYKSKIENIYPIANDSHMKQGVRDLWAEQLGIIINGYNDREDYSLIAWANGVYLYAMQCYSKVMDTEDIKKIQEELISRIAAKGGFNTLDDVRTIFPVLKGVNFTVNENGGTGESAWWQKFAPDNLPDRFCALYLPLRAEGSVTISHGLTTTIKMDYVLVPFNMMTDKTPVEGRALKETPINPFYMATLETTGEQMQAFWRSKGRIKETDPSEPYSYASLEEAIDFCNWLSEKDGLESLYERKEDSSGWNLDLRKPGYRLPFDFEWEYAARFGYDFFQKSGESDWNTMKAELDKKTEEQASIEDINSGLVNYYYQASLRTPQKGSEYPLGMYDLCGNAPEICMTVKDLPKKPELVEIEFIQMLGGNSISDIEAVAPWLSEEEPNGVNIMDESRGGYGFRVIRTVPVCLFE